MAIFLFFLFCERYLFLCLHRDHRGGGHAPSLTGNGSAGVQLL
jgi:hypothetical protein